MRYASLVLCFVLALGAPAQAYQYWNDIRHSAPLPDDSVVVRVENPTGAGMENRILYADEGVHEVVMSEVDDGPSTLQAIVPGPVSETRFYGFRMTDAGELDLLPIRVEGGTGLSPGDLTQLAPDPAGDETYGYDNLDIVDCRVSFSDTRLYASLQNVGGGFPVSSGLTFFGYLLGIADPAEADPDTIFALMHTYQQTGIISPGLYKITGTGLGDLEKLGDVDVQEFPANSSLMLSCELADLTQDPYFSSWYDPGDPVIGVAGFTQRITLFQGAQEADSSPGGRCWLRDVTIEPGTNALPQLEDAEIQGSGQQAVALIDYFDPDGHCPVTAEVVFDDSDTFDLRPQTLDYGSTVVYATEDGIAPLAGGAWSVARFVFSDDQSSVVEYSLPSTDVPGGDWSAEPASLLAAASPNPFSGSTTLELVMPAAGRATVAVYDVRGALVRTLHDGDVSAGPLWLEWDGRGDRGGELGSGVYFMRASALGMTEARKVVLTR